MYLVATLDGKQIFVTGHSEYDPLSLKWEYDRDVGKGMDVEVPKNYFPTMIPSAHHPQSGGHTPIYYSRIG